MPKKPFEEEEWTESVFNDPRQLVMEFAVIPESDFETFHRKNPQIWRDFRKTVLARFNKGERSISIAAIIKDITGGVTLKPEIIDRYWQLFVSNHQEMQNVLTRTDIKEHAPT